MEVTSHECKTRAWIEINEAAEHVFREWLAEPALEATRQVVKEHDVMTRRHVDALEELSAYLTGAQQRYAKRLYRDAGSDMPATAPWPAPSPVEPPVVTVFDIILRAEDLSSPRKWAAYRLLLVASTIKAARRIRQRVFFDE